MLSELLPAGSLPAGVNRVKLVLGRAPSSPRLAIMGGRSGPACLAPTPAARANTLAGFLPGTSPAGVLGSIGVPGTRSPFVWRYCVAGGGQLAVVFPRRGGASLIATTARGYRLGGIGAGTSLLQPPAPIPSRSAASGRTSAARHADRAACSSSDPGA